MKDEISAQALATMLLRWRRLIVTLALTGAAAGLLYGLVSRRVYQSTATFVPQASSASASSAGLAMAASQLGIQIPLPNAGQAWGPPVYLELLQSHDLLGPIAMDTVTVAEEGNRKARVIDLLDVPADLPAPLRAERAVAVLRKHINASEDKRVAGVDVTVETRWPSVSYALATRVVNEVNRFNLVVKKSQAAEERRFVDAQAAEAEKALRAAEDQLQAFQQSNRSTNSPSLVFEQERLQRQVSLRQAVYTSLMQNREEARIREVRDTPVITVLVSPRLPAASKPRRALLKAFLGGLTAGLLGILIALSGEALRNARRSTRKETRELLELLHESTPRILRRGK